jgi:hypothetical protein
MNKQVRNKALMLRWYDQLWNNGDEAIIDELMHAQCRAFGLGPEPVIGAAGFKQFYRVLFQAIHVLASLQRLAYTLITSPHQINNPFLPATPTF